jgi:hypothetical protein
LIDLTPYRWVKDTTPEESSLSLIVRKPIPRK